MWFTRSRILDYNVAFSHIPNYWSPQMCTRVTVVEPFPYYRAFLGDEQAQSFVPEQ